MACIISSIDLLYLMETYWFRWIIFNKGNFILLICPFYFSIRHSRTRKIFSFTDCSRNSKKLCSSAPIEHSARDIGTVKWHPYNVEVKVISFVKYFNMELSIFNAHVNIKKRGTRIFSFFSSNSVKQNILMFTYHLVIATHQ